MGKPIFGSSHMKYLKMNNKIAIFPGSFDPITIGHCDIVKRALPLFDEIIIAIGVNNQKKVFVSPGNEVGMDKKRI